MYFYILYISKIYHKYKKLIEIKIKFNKNKVEYIMLQSNYCHRIQNKDV